MIASANNINLTNHKNMKSHFLICYLALLGSVLFCGTAAAQQKLSKKEAKKVMTGVWQMTGANYNASQSVVIKMYLADGSYEMTRTFPQRNQSLTLQKGTWKIVKPGILEERTTFNIMHNPKDKKEKSRVAFEIIDDDHMVIIWKDEVTGMSGKEAYTRVSQ